MKFTITIIAEIEAEDMKDALRLGDSFTRSIVINEAKVELVDVKKK